MEKMTQVYYDKDSDVFYLSIGEARPAISREIGDDVLLRIDAETGQVVGLTILNLSSSFGNLQSPHHIPVETVMHEVDS